MSDPQTTTSDTDSNANADANADAKKSDSPTLAQRLSGAHVGLRDDLEVSRHVFRNQPSYVIRDPISFQTHCLNVTEYKLLTTIDADRSLGEIFESIVEAGILRQNDEDFFYRFITSLHRLGVLSLPSVDDKALYRRHVARKRAGRKQLIMAPLFFRIPVTNPDIFLNKTVEYVRPLFSKWALVGWLALILTAGFVAIQNSSRLAVPLGGILAAGNIAIMWVTLIVLKLLHELGHAYACKVFGGHVPEMGLYMIAGTPCAYVDATASWGFSKKSHRLIVCLAGVYIELAVAAVALLIWSVTRSPLLSSVMFNVALLSSVVTIAFNINPLMRYDGYYVLSDLLEIPNLRQKSRDYIVSLAKRFALGISQQNVPVTTGLKATYIIYGVSSSLYRVCVVMGIAILIASKIFLLGLIIGGFYIVNELQRTVRTTAHYLLKSHETDSVRPRAIAVAVILFLVLPAGLFLAPIPHNVQVSGVLGGEHEKIIHATTPGFVREVKIPVGQVVQTGQQIAQLDNDDFRKQFADAKCEYQIAELRHQASEAVGPADIKRTSEMLKWYKSQLMTRQSEYEGLAIKAVNSGRIVAGLGQRDIGRYVNLNEKIATISSGQWTVRTVLREEDLTATNLAVGQTVEFRCASEPSREYRGTVIRVSPQGDRQVSLAQLTQLGGGEIAVDTRTFQAEHPHFEVDIKLDNADSSALKYGMTGTIQIASASEPVGTSLIRSVLRFVDHLHRDR